MPLKSASNSQVAQYLGPKFEQFFDFEPQLKSVNWRELFLAKGKDSENAAKAKNLKEFRKVFVDSWKKTNIQSLVKKLDLSF